MASVVDTHQGEILDCLSALIDEGNRPYNFTRINQASNVLGIEGEEELVAELSHQAAAHLDINLKRKKMRRQMEALVWEWVGALVNVQFAFVPGYLEDPEFVSGSGLSREGEADVEVWGAKWNSLISNMWTECTGRPRFDLDGRTKDWLRRDIECWQDAQLNSPDRLLYLASIRTESGRTLGTTVQDDLETFLDHPITSPAALYELQQLN